MIAIDFNKISFILSNQNDYFPFLFIYFQLDLQLQDEAGGDISSFVTNGEWELLGKLCYINTFTFRLIQLNT